MRDPVAIAGYGAISAVGQGVPALQTALATNASGLRLATRFDDPRYQSGIVGAAPADESGGNPDDPAYRLATTALTEARAAAHELLATIPPERIGLLLATTKANIEALELLAAQRPCSAAARRHLQADLLAADLAAAQGVRGPVQAISLACVSGLVALQQGVSLIQRGTVDAVLVVGVDHLSAFVLAGFTALKAIDPQGCRPFDQGRCGLSPGEAGAAIVLTRASLVNSPAIIIQGSGISNDANHMTGPSRDGAGLALAIRSALNAAGLEPSAIDYVNMHGTGTPYNDAMELQALAKIFGTNCPPFSGSKGMFGHTLGAAGVLETILCAVAMKMQLLPGTPRLNVAMEGAGATLVREPRAADRLAKVLKLNVGFGGFNGALILSHG